MEKVGVSDLLDYQIDRLIVVCKTVQKRKREGIEISLKISLQECPSDFSEQVEEELVLSSQTGGKKFIETLLRERLKGEWITGFTQGTNLLLPPSFRRFYKECTKLETESFTLYLTDYARRVFVNTIHQFDERSKRDSLSFVKAKLENKEAKHLLIQLYENPYRQGRSVFLEQEATCGFFHPPQSAYYSVQVGKQGKVSLEDAQNVLSMIDCFVDTYGPFSHAEWNGKECVAYNENSMKLVGY